MAQYNYFADNKFQEFTDENGVKFRIGQRDHYAVCEKEVLGVWESMLDEGEEVTGSRVRFGVRSGNFQVDIELTATGFDGTESTAGTSDDDWKNVFEIVNKMTIVKNPDALFDSRSGLTISDSVGSEEISIKDFPFLNPIDNAETINYALPYSATLGMSYLAPDTGDFTAVFFFRPSQGSTNYTYLNNLGGRDGQTIRIQHSTKTALANVGGNTGNIAIPDSANYLTNLYMATVTHDTDGDPKTVARVYNTSTNYAQSTANNAAGATTNYSLRVYNAPNASCGLIKYYYYTRKLSDAEITGIWNGTIPSDGLVSFVNLCNDIKVLAAFADAVADKYGLGGTTAAVMPKSPYLVRETFEQLADLLKYGYTQRGYYQFCYKPDSTKGITALIDDIEHTASGVIHNLADSRLYFDGVTDTDIKAIFDKSNTTYWKATIQSEDHYVDAGGGYYGVWHPSQLNREFIEAHAQAGHDGHIFPSLRTSGTVITGITEIRVYKTNI